MTRTGRRRLGQLAVVLGLLAAASAARPELAAWDHARVRALAEDLVQATDALHKTFRKKEPPPVASLQSHAYYRIRHWVRVLHVESHELARSLERGEEREQTLPIYENLMQLARSARDDAARVLVAHDVSERAAAVRRVLNQLGPYYDPDFPPLAPHPNIESGANP
jgi:hypothetical protein